MSRKKRIIIGLLLAFGGLFLCVVATWTFLQSNWLKTRVRNRIVSAAERATGGRVELGAVDYDWYSLTLHFHHVVIHGTEPPRVQPLFKAKSVDIGLTIHSLLQGDIRLNFLTLDQPEVHLQFNGDGTSNIPQVARANNKGHIAEDILDLQAKRYQLKNGAVKINWQRFPLDVEGKDMTALLKYDRQNGGSYHIAFSSTNTSSWPPRLAKAPVNLTLHARLKQDRITFDQVDLQSSAFRLKADGYLANFVHPQAMIDLHGRFAGNAITEALDLPEWHGSQLLIDGVGQYDLANAARFTGRVQGNDITYQTPRFALRHMQVTSHVEADMHGANLTDLQARAPAGSFVGQFTTSYKEFQLAGRVNRWSLGDVLSATTHRQNKWSGFLSGPVQLTGLFRKTDVEDLSIEGALAIAPGTTGIPVAGRLQASYKELGKVTKLQDSYLSLPHTSITASGTVSKNIKLAVATSNIADFQPIIDLVQKPGVNTTFPLTLLQDGTAQFKGNVIGSLDDPRIAGDLLLTRFLLHGYAGDRLHSQIDLSPHDLKLTSISAEQDGLHLNGELDAGLNHWGFDVHNHVLLNVQFSGANLGKLMQPYANRHWPVSLGTASGSVELSGSLNNPNGKAQLTIDDALAYGQPLHGIKLRAAAADNTVQITSGRLQAGLAAIDFAGTYRHAPETWRSGDISIRLDSNRFSLASLQSVHEHDPTLEAAVQIHERIGASLDNGRFHLVGANGNTTAQSIDRKNIAVGNLTLDTTTENQILHAKLRGTFRNNPLHGSATVQLTGDLPAQGQLDWNRIDLANVLLLLSGPSATALPLDGFWGGGLVWEAPLLHLDRLRARAHIDSLQLTPRTKTASMPLLLRSEQTILVEAANGIASISGFHLSGPNTQLTLAGSVPYLQRRPWDLHTTGTVDLKLLTLFYPDLQSSGECQLSASIAGTLHQPKIDGLIRIRRGLLYGGNNNLPDGLSEIDGAIKFDGNRASVQRLTAHSGGGNVSMTGFVSFVPDNPLVYRLEAQANNVRVRYAGGVSLTADSGLRLTGTSKNSLLAGTVTVDRIALNPNADIGTLLTLRAAPSPVDEQNFVSGLQLDVRVESAPDLQVTTSLSQDVEAEIDLRLRGKPSRPSLLGAISANQGNIKVFGANYSINRGEISFTNPNKIEPVLDLDLQTQARGITVDVTVSGTPAKLNINYRSDPPLQPRDIIALLTVGRAPDVASNIANTRVTNDVSALRSGANTVLGQAFAPVSNRLSKLFGITNIKIDPLVQGITNTPQARLTLQQQVSRDISVTYVTNLSQTSEQIFRFEWALNRQYSIIALRDDNGEFGIDIQFKKRFK